MTDIISPDFYISFSELRDSTHIKPDYLVQLIDYQVITPTSGNAPAEWMFTVSSVAIVNNAARLHRELDIEWTDIGLVINLLEKIDQLKNENLQLKLQVQRLSHPE